MKVKVTYFKDSQREPLKHAIVWASDIDEAQQISDALYMPLDATSATFAILDADAAPMPDA